MVLADILQIQLCFSMLRLVLASFLSQSCLLLSVALYKHENPFQIQKGLPGFSNVLLQKMSKICQSVRVFEWFGQRVA